MDIRRTVRDPRLTPMIDTNATRLHNIAMDEADAAAQVTDGAGQSDRILLTGGQGFGRSKPRYVATR
jgi:hypothetical protein